MLRPKPTQMLLQNLLKGATFLFMSIWWITFFKHLYSLLYGNRMYKAKLVENVRSSPTSISISSYIELNQTRFFPVSIFNNTHRENCVLLNSVQKFIEIEVWLLLAFSLCLHNQLASTHSITTYYSSGYWGFCQLNVAEGGGPDPNSFLF